MAKKHSYRDELIAEIRSLSQTHGQNEVFTTFLEITATSIAAQMDPSNAAEREKRYGEMASQMKLEDLNAYARMFVLLCLVIYEHEEDPCDVLGGIYHELRLNNEWNGQFFTPDDICRCMAEILNPADEFADGDGPVTINEPACGSGAMILGVVWAMKRKGFDFRRNSFFVAQDIDIRCVWMAYIQLSLYGIPAVVIHGNTLTLEEWSHWHTPCAAIPFMEKPLQKEA